MPQQKALMQTFAPGPRGEYDLNQSLEDQISSRINYSSHRKFFFLDNPNEFVQMSDIIEFTKKGAFVNGREIGSYLRYGEGEYVLCVPQPRKLRNYKTLQLIDPLEINVVTRKGVKCPRLYVNNMRVISEIGFNENIRLEYKDNSEQVTFLEKQSVEYKGGKFYVGDKEVIRVRAYKKMLSPYQKPHQKKLSKPISNAEKNSSALLNLATIAEANINFSTNDLVLPSIKGLLLEEPAFNMRVSRFQSNVTFFRSLPRPMDKSELALDLEENIKLKL